MNQLFCIIFGTFLIIFAIAGFMPILVNQGFLFNLFRINFEYKILHFSIGFLGVLCGTTDKLATRNYFFATHFFFGFLAIWGFFQKSEKLFFMFAANNANHYLHLGISFVLLVLFLYSNRNKPLSCR